MSRSGYGFIVVAALFAVCAIGAGAHASLAAAPQTQGEMHPSLSAAALQAKYASGQKIKILVVPGHEPDYGGAEFADVKERDLVVPIADQLAAKLRKDPHFDVIETRSATSWSPFLLDYFENDWLYIQSFVAANKAAVSDAMDDGAVLEDEESVDHITADPDVALRLFGITKWADENSVDLAIHIHLNDAVGHSMTEPGPYAGFALYVPDHQFNNASSSLAVATDIAARLSAYHATSTLPGETAGIISDQDLIAIGSDDTASYPSVLAELAYIYEPQFWHPQARAIATADYADELALGIEDFFGTPGVSKYGTSIFPHTYAATSPALQSNSADAYALQVALRHLGFYPAAGSSLSDCPISGLMGPCTVAALKAFQAAHHLTQTGALGPQTRALLQKLFP